MLQVFPTLEWLAFGFKDNVASRYSASVCRTTSPNSNHKDALLLRYVVGLGDFMAQSHTRDSKVRPNDVAMFYDLSGDPSCGIDWDGESNTLSERYVRRIHPDNHTRTVDQWSTAVARVDGGVGLYQILVHVIFNVDVAFECAYYSNRRRRSWEYEPVWVSDRNRDLSNN